MVAIAPAVAVNVPVVAPEATVTDAGTVNAPLLLDSETVTPAPPAGRVSVAVHEDVPGAFTEVGLQARVLRVAGTGTAIVPPAPLRLRAAPAGDAATVLVTPMGIVPDADADSVTLTTAAGPFKMDVAFVPATMHVYEPVADAQVMVLPAAVADEPAEALILAMLAAL